MRRSAIIRIGEPVDVGSYLAGYEERGTRRETILGLTRDLQTSIQVMIDAAGAAADQEVRA